MIMTEMASECFIQYFELSHFAARDGPGTRDDLGWKTNCVPASVTNSVRRIRNDAHDVYFVDGFNRMKDMATFLGGMMNPKVHGHVL